MLTPMNDALDMTQITVAELRTWIDEAREMTLACLEGTSLRTIRQAHLDRLCAELKRRWD
jgi:hypothetical protein